MSFVAIMVLAVGLSLDAAAVAASRGLLVERVGLREISRVALFFGGFQAVMPLFGMVLGERLGPHIARFDHWIAFALLVGLGAKMLHEAFSSDADAPVARGDPFAPAVMLTLAIATSIDALAVGLMLPLLNAPLVLSVATIGITTALLSTVGLLLGRRFGDLFGKRLDALGGVVLIGLGIKVLYEHLTGAA